MLSIIKAQLVRSIDEEQIASKHYRARAEYAKNHNDMVTYNLYLHIAREEDVHANEFNRRLKTLKKESK
jgi:rubrerythrin